MVGILDYRIVSVIFPICSSFHFGVEREPQIGADMFDFLFCANRSTRPQTSFCYLGGGIWEETLEERHLRRGTWDDSGETCDPLGSSGIIYLGSSGIVWDHMGSSGIIWVHLGSPEKPGVIWNHFGSSGIICEHVGSFEIIWDDLGSLGSSRLLKDHLRSFGIIWDHLGSSGMIWDHLGSLWKSEGGLWEGLSGVQRAPGSSRNPQGVLEANIAISFS